MKLFVDQELEKQNNIINAAMTCFGINGYKKTSIQDVATQAKVSKALLFHYFGSKKALYVYTLNYANQFSSERILANIDNQCNDLFEVLHQIQEEKFMMYDKHPDLFKFLESAHFELDIEVVSDIKSIQKSHYSQQISKLLAGIDTSNFRNGVTLQRAMNLVTWVTEGYVKSLQSQNPLMDQENFAEYEFYFTLLKEAILKED